jgi:5-methylcytosine-specific restriction endonuclease McrA
VTHNNDSYEWKQTVKRIRARDDYTCQQCGHHDETSKTLHVDHIWPKAAGGSDEDSNLRVLCSKCNQKKGAKTGPQRTTWYNPRWLTSI